MPNVTSVESTLDFGPGKLQKNDVNDPFILAKSQYIDLQVYVAKGKALPKNFPDLRNSWNLNGAIDITMFGDLLPAYQQITNHCVTWESITLPLLRTLADQLYTYGIQAPDYYGALLCSLNTIADTNSTPAKVAQAKQDFKDIAAELSSQIKTYKAQCEKVQKGINDFREGSKRDDETLDRLYADYDRKYGSTSGELSQLRKELDEAIAGLSAAEAEYKHDVTVAATTATYAWVGVFGLISAAVVAGVYGDKAVKAKQAIESFNDQIKTLGDQIQRDQSMLCQLSEAKKQVKEIDDSLGKALDVINEVKDAWDSIGYDLGNLSTRIDKISSDEVTAIIKKVNINTSIDQWSEITKDADHFRHHFTVDILGSANSPVNNVMMISGQLVAA